MWPPPRNGPTGGGPGSLSDPDTETSRPHDVMAPRKIGNRQGRNTGHNW